MNPFTRNESASSILGDQFKNTRVWDQIVYAFCLGVPVSRHRRRLRCYKDCFVAKSAVDWLHHHLQESSHFENVQVSRFQAVQLLRKFHKCDIITRVDGKENIQRELQDNNELYRLSQAVLDELPVVEPVGGENNISNIPNVSTVSTVSTNRPVALQNCSMANGSVIVDCNPVATVENMRRVRRSYSNVSSLRPYDLPQLNCCVNSAFNTSLSDERTPLKSLQMQRSFQPQANRPSVSKSLYEANAAARIRNPVNVFWL